MWLIYAYYDHFPVCPEAGGKRSLIFVSWTDANTRICTASICSWWFDSKRRGGLSSDWCFQYSPWNQIPVQRLHIVELWLRDPHGRCVAFHDLVQPSIDNLCVHWRMLQSLNFLIIVQSQQPMNPSPIYSWKMRRPGMTRDCSCRLPWRIRSRPGILYDTIPKIRHADIEL